MRARRWEEDEEEEEEAEEKRQGVASLLNILNIVREKHQYICVHPMENPTYAAFKEN